MCWARVRQFRYSHSVEDNQASPWSAAPWRRFGLDQARSITKRRQGAALQGDAHSPAFTSLEQRLELQRLDQLTKQVASMIVILLDERGTVDGICRLA